MRIVWYGVFLLVSGIVAFLVAHYVWRRKTVPETFWFALFMFAIALWALAGSFEFLSEGLSRKILWAKISYAGIVNVAPLWFLFALRRERKAGDGTPLVFFLWIIPLFIFGAALTNDIHGLLWAAVDIVEADGHPVIRYMQGPLYLVNVLYSYVVFGGGTVLLVRSFHRGGDLRQGLLLAATGLLPWGANLLYLSGRSPDNADLTPVAFVITGLWLFWIILRFRILDIAPFARDLLFREMGDGVLVIDARHRVMDMNPAAEKNLGISSTDRGKPAAEILRDWPGLVERCSVTDDAESSLSFETTYQDNWFDVRISPLRGSRGRVQGKLLVFRDIGARKRLEDELLQYATIDILTGVYNRRMGLTILDQQLRFAERNGTYLTICFVDINDLKMVNDNYGHAEGDFLIRRVSGILRETLRESDVLCRLGGDEFLIILPDCALTQARAVWRRACEKLGAARRQDRKPFPYRVARGFAEYAPGSGWTADELLSMADAAMYRHKERMKGLESDGEDRIED